MKTTAIIVAAGSGSRLGSHIPKQFLSIGGKPLIVHTLASFQAAPSVDSIILVLADDQIVGFDAGKIPKLSRIVTGGSTRADSVLNGLNAVDAETAIVAVHDGARPLVTTNEIEWVIAKAKETGAACLVAPVTDTIKSVRGGEITTTLDRSELRRALTPQAFKIELLKNAFAMCELDENVTDECYLVEKLGHPIAVIEGSLRNIKVTHPEDLVLAETLLNMSDI